MNLPNKLTMLRILLIPLFLVFFFQPMLIPHNYLWALLTFALASVTDLLDGKIARKHGLVTDFGKLMDPLADKLLVMAAMVSFIDAEMVHPAIVIIILAREFLVTSIRLVAASSGTVLAADGWGKVKTTVQMLWICYGLLLLGVSEPPAIQPFLNGLYYVLLILVTVLTLVSGFNYLWNNRKLFRDA